MRFEIKRIDFSKTDVFITSLSKEPRTIKAEALYDFLYSKEEKQKFHIESTLESIIERCLDFSKSDKTDKYIIEQIANECKRELKQIQSNYSYNTFCIDISFDKKKCSKERVRQIIETVGIERDEYDIDCYFDNINITIKESAFVLTSMGKSILLEDDIP